MHRCCSAMYLATVMVVGGGIPILFTKIKLWDSDLKKKTHEHPFKHWNSSKDPLFTKKKFALNLFQKSSFWMEHGMNFELNFSNQTLFREFRNDDDWCKMDKKLGDKMIMIRTRNVKESSSIWADDTTGNFFTT